MSISGRGVRYIDKKFQYQYRVGVFKILIIFLQISILENINIYIIFQSGERWIPSLKRVGSNDALLPCFVQFSPGGRF